MKNSSAEEMIKKMPLGWALHRFVEDKAGKPCDYIFVDVNAAFEALTGLSSVDILGRKVTEVLPSILEDSFDWIKSYAKVAYNDEKMEFEQYSRSLDKWYRVNAYSAEAGSFITIIADVTKERSEIIDLHRLSVMAEEFLQGLGKASDYQIITDHFLEITDAKLAAFNLYDEDGKQYTTMAVAGDRGNIDKAMNIIGMKLEGKKWIHDSVRNAKIKDKIVTRFPTLHDLSGEVIPKLVSNLLTKSFGLGETVVVKIAKDNIMLGDFTLIMPKGKSFDKDSIAEIFTRQLGLALARARSEAALRQSEALNRSIVNTIPDILFLISMSGEFLNVISSDDQELFMPKQELIGNRIVDILPKEVSDILMNAIQGAVLTNTLQICEYELAVPAGLMYFEARIVPNDMKSAYAMVRNISELKKQETIIRQREAEYRSLAENAPDGIARFDESLRHVYVNDKAAVQWGLSNEDFLGKTNRELGMPEDTLEKWEAGLRAVFQSKQVQIVDVSSDTPQGKKYYQSLLAPEPSNDGEVHTVLSITRDISSQKEIELELNEKQADLKEAQHMAQLGRWDLYHDDGRLQWTETIFEIFEIDSKHFGASYEAFLTAIHPDDRMAVDEAWKRSLADKEPYYIEHRLLMDDGRIKWVYEQCRTEFDKAGQPIHSIGIVQDITTRKEMEWIIIKEKEQFKATLLSVGDGVISTDNQGNVLIMNEISEQLTGWTKEEATGKSIEEVFHIVNEFTREKFDNPVSKVLETGNIIELANHALLISKDKTERPIEDSAAPIKDEQGNITGVVLVFRDFTEKKKSQDEIEYLSFHDHLTGLYNRRFFEAELTRLDTKRNWPLTIVMGDANGLKLINDTFGHATGDQLLIKMAEIIKQSCRADDIIARIGGDEFSILLPKTGGFEAAQLIKRINGFMKEATFGDLEISISFGYETKNDEADETKVMVKKAEDNMYSNKLFEGPSVRRRMIDNIIATVDAKIPSEKAHSERVSVLSVAIGTELKLEAQEIETLRMFSSLHDIGKVAIADNILKKPAELTGNEWVEMRRHSEIGYRILSTANDMSEIAEYVLAHHERWDGKGYPKGLKGEAIPLQSRVLAIADAYDAMTNERPFREATSRDAAIEEIRRSAGTQFDPVIAELFIERVLGQAQKVLL